MKRCTEEPSICAGSGHMKWKITNHQHHNSRPGKGVLSPFRAKQAIWGRFKTCAMCCIIYKLLRANTGEEGESKD